MRQSARKRVTAKGSTVVADLDLGSDVLVDDRSGDREAVADGLGGRQDIGVSFPGQGRVRPKGSRAGQTALDLVVVEQRAHLAAALTQRHEEFLGGGHHASLTLDGLDDDGAGLFGDQRGDSGDVVVSAYFEAGDHGRKRGLVLGVGRGGERTHGAAVEGVLKADNFDFGTGGVEHLADFTGELDTGFVGFGPGVADEDGGGVVHAARGLCGFDEELGERAGPGVVVEVGGVDEFLGLWRQLLSQLTIILDTRRS